MSVLLAGTIGFVIAVAVLQLLQRDAVRIVVGLYLLWNATNLLLLGSGTIRAERAPVAGIGEGTTGDPLVQALVLTSIIVTFGFTVLLVTMVFWLARRESSIDVDEFRRSRG
jgi:multicomponent Na+:H+ antiporter subunit C